MELASEEGGRLRTLWAAGAVGGEDAELADGFPELPKLNLFSFLEVRNQETFFSVFPLPRLGVSFPITHAIVGPLPFGA
jgi:hypothetical protein